MRSDLGLQPVSRRTDQPLLNAATVLSLVERGWYGARICSLALAGRGVAVTHLIRGVLGPNVRGIIQPHARIRLVEVPRPLYVVALWTSVLVGGALRRIRWVLVDNERTLHRLQWCEAIFGVTAVLMREESPAYALSIRGRVLPLDEFCRRVADGAISQPRSRNTSRGEETGGSNAFRNTSGSA